MASPATSRSGRPRGAGRPFSMPGGGKRGSQEFAQALKFVTELFLTHGEHLCDTHTQWNMPFVCEGLNVTELLTLKHQEL